MTPAAGALGSADCVLRGWNFPHHIRKESRKFYKDVRRYRSKRGNEEESENTGAGRLSACPVEGQVWRTSWQLKQKEKYAQIKEKRPQC